MRGAQRSSSSSPRLHVFSLQDVQNLSSKYRCDETASIQQAMRWANLGALLPLVMHMPSDSLMSSQGLQQQEEREAGTELAAAGLAAEGSGQEEEEPRSDQEDAEFASRLSFAALQWLPESTQTEKVEVQRGRLLAMDTLSVLERLEIACEVMSEQRNSLAAKVALKTLR